MRQVTLGKFLPEMKPRLALSGTHADCFKVEKGQIIHPFINEGTISHRTFQLDIAIQALEENTLVVLPTGLGKTIVAALVTAEVLNHGLGTILFLAPTKPLAQQHMQSFEKLISSLLPMQLFTGTMKASKREGLWDETKIIFATPQGISNDLGKERYTLRNVAFVIFDEAHRAVGDYAYVPIAAKYKEQRDEPLVLGLTASPGSDRMKIEEVVQNLGISNVEARNEEDPDVQPYVQETNVIWHKVKLTTNMVRARRAFEEAFIEHVNKLKRLGFLRHRKKGQKASKKDIIKAGEEIRARLAKGGRMRGMMFGAMHHQAIALQVVHCLELLETQGVEPTLAYLARLRAEEKPKKSLKAFLKNEKVLRAMDHLSKHKGVSHPKVDELVAVIHKQLDKRPDSLIIAFSQFRDTISGLMERLRSEGFNAERFVGQAHRKGDPGLSQKEQAAILDRFRKREFNILVASSVAEEGLDIPAVDLVIFYEPIPSEVRAIQRRGRTGRNAAGRIVVLVTEDTRDETFLYVEMSREKKMRGMVRRMAGKRSRRRKQ